MALVAVAVLLIYGSAGNWLVEDVLDREDDWANKEGVCINVCIVIFWPVVGAGIVIAFIAKLLFYELPITAYEWWSQLPDTKNDKKK